MKKERVKIYVLIILNLVAILSSFYVERISLEKDFLYGAIYCIIWCGLLCLTIFQIRKCSKIKKVALILICLASFVFLIRLGLIVRFDYEITHGLFHAS